MEQTAHERADREPQLRPQVGVVRLEDRELRAEMSELAMKSVSRRTGTYLNSDA